MGNGYGIGQSQIGRCHIQQHEKRQESCATEAKGLQKKEKGEKENE
jgi:hypothetical protein